MRAGYIASELKTKDIITHTSSSFSGHAIRARVRPRAHSCCAHVCMCVAGEGVTDLNFAHVHCVASAYTPLCFAGIGDIFLRADDFSLAYFLLKSRRLCGSLSKPSSSGKREVVHEQGLRFFEIRLDLASARQQRSMRSLGPLRRHLCTRRFITREFTLVTSRAYLGQRSF